MPQCLPPVPLSQVCEQIHARGKVQLVFYRPPTRLLPPFQEEIANRITRLGRERFSHLFGGDREALPPSQIAIGSGCAPASPEDRCLEKPGIRLPFSAPPAYSGASVTFQAELGQDQAIGLGLREFGLLDAADTLLARFVREENTVKTGDMGLLLFWKIEF